jgi:hypothetical protein
MLFCLVAYRALVFRVERRIAIVVCSLVLLVAMATPVMMVGSLMARVADGFLHPRQEDYVAAAQNLERLGLRPGDKLAVMGNPLLSYYARYDRLRVVAQIDKPGEFWRLSPAELVKVEDRLASAGVKAIVAFQRPATDATPGWTDFGSVDGFPLSVLLIQPAEKVSH